MSIIVIGVGAKASTKGEKMREVAGSEGKVLLYADFDVLLSQFDEILKAACGKLAIPRGMFLVVG